MEDAKEKSWQLGKLGLAMCDRRGPKRDVCRNKSGKYHPSSAPIEGEGSFYSNAITGSHQLQCLVT